MNTDFVYAIAFVSTFYEDDDSPAEVIPGVDAIFDSISDAVKEMEYEFHEYDEDGTKTNKGIKSEILYSEEKKFQGYIYHDYCDKTMLYGGKYIVTHMRLTQIHKKHVHINN